MKKFLKSMFLFTISLLCVYIPIVILSMTHNFGWLLLYLVLFPLSVKAVKRSQKISNSI